MPAPIDFYFDFSSPYGYLASQKIDAIAEKHERAVNWRPILLGAIFKITGSRPLANMPLKGDYSVHDMPRFARLLDVPFNMPAKFPIATQAAARAFYWAHDRDPQLARKLALALYHAYFADGRDISDPETVADIAGSLDIDRAQLLAALGDGAIKERLKNEIDAAIARKVFGSPFIIIDGEPFWGADRLGQVEHWLATGGW
ncbi:MAG TPA: 2-hydroxychromene-2-carboxylate isomerase [Burkholderiales bacterium]|nr:2-hydroxychromene-2-carboxylate isomerase [Burkholderiales bacterium]